MTATCDLCERPTDGCACNNCAEQARRDLATVARHAGDARAIANRQTRRGPNICGSGEERLPINLAAGARLDAVTNELTGWVRHIAETRGIPEPTGTLHAIATWLTEHLEWIRHRQEAAECLLDIAACRRVIVALVDGPPGRRWLGTCQADTDTGTCPADLYARPDARHVTCRACGTQHDVAELRAWLEQLARGYSYTPGEIEAAYPGIKAATIRVWAHRGRITASGEVDGRPVYPLGAVLDFAAAEVARRARRAKGAA